MNRRVLVGMSGGIDSSVACMLLQRQGYEVVGLTLRMWEKTIDKGLSEPQCVSEARLLAERLGMEYHVLDVQEEFHRCVLSDFVGEYMAGRTPNPCVQCNIHIKMKYLRTEADRLGCTYIATGHYARIIEEHGTFFIEKAKDEKKDQSYFLWGVRQQELSRLIFPLGEFTKDEVRTIAREAGFGTIANKAESQDICFVETDYRDFLRVYHPNIDVEVGQGNFVDRTGKVLGCHKGYPYYTIGQRKGLEIALGEPMYVLSIDAGRNEVMIGSREHLPMSSMELRDCYFPSFQCISSDEILDIRVRYKSRAVSGCVEYYDNGRAHIRFITLIDAITPGQSAVIYRGSRVIGGGIIC